MNRFLRLFDDFSKGIEIRLKEITLALEDVPLLKDQIFALQKIEDEQLKELARFKRMEVRYVEGDYEEFIINTKEFMGKRVGVYFKTGELKLKKIGGNE